MRSEELTIYRAAQDWASLQPFGQASLYLSPGLFRPLEDFTAVKPRKMNYCLFVPGIRGAKRYALMLCCDFVLFVGICFCDLFNF